MPLITVAALSTLLGPNYVVRTSKNGCQVNLNLRVLTSDGEKLRALLDGFEKVKQAGYDIDDSNLQCATPPQNPGGAWRSWLCFYVNRPSRGESTRQGPAYSAAEVIEMKKAGVTIEEIMMLAGVRPKASSQEGEDLTPDDVTDSGDGQEDETPVV